MSLPRYAEYKDSGVEWLGQIPVHWQVYPFKRALAFLTSGSRGWAEYYADDGAIFLRISNLTRNSICLDLTDIQRVAAPDGTEGERTKVKSGDILFSITAYLGSVAVVPEDLGHAFVSQHIALARLSQNHVLPKWVAYVVLSSVGQTYFEAKGYGGTKLQLGLEDVENLLLTVPPLAEQTVVAVFLDRETAKIDALIAEQEKLIALLAEKRQATISHAVTRGLNPAATMKDSGVAWLGEVPAHWEVRRLGTLTSKIGSGKTPSGGADVYGDVGVMFLRSQNIYDEGLMLDDVVFISESIDEEMAGTRVKGGDILLNITGASLGRTCLVPDEFTRANVNQHVCIVRLAELEFRAFVSLALKSSPIKAQIDATQNGAAREGLNFEQIGKLALPLPPACEQREIEMFVATELNKLDALSTESARATALLKERRSALIAAAVTGQIDVRQTM